MSDRENRNDESGLPETKRGSGRPKKNQDKDDGHDSEENRSFLDTTVSRISMNTVLFEAKDLEDLIMIGNSGDEASTEGKPSAKPVIIDVSPTSSEKPNGVDAIRRKRDDDDNDADDDDSGEWEDDPDDDRDDDDYDDDDDTDDGERMDRTAIPGNENGGNGHDKGQEQVDATPADSTNSWANYFNSFAGDKTKIEQKIEKPDGRILSPEEAGLIGGHPVNNRKPKYPKKPKGPSQETLDEIEAEETEIDLDLKKILPETEETIKALEPVIGLVKLPKTKQWEILDGEPLIAYKGFVIYRDIGPRRTLVRVFRKLLDELKEVDSKWGRRDFSKVFTLEIVQSWEKTFRWDERITAWTLYLDREARKGMIQERIATSKRHAEILDDVIESGYEKLIRNFYQIPAEDLLHRIPALISAHQKVLGVPFSMEKDELEKQIFEQVASTFRSVMPRLFEAINNNVTDPEMRKKIARDLAEVTDVGKITAPLNVTRKGRSPKDG